MNDEEIIAEGLSQIRNGLINKSLEEIAAGYELISGEKIEIEQKTKLERIREALASKKGIEEKGSEHKENDQIEEPIDSIVTNEIDGGKNFGQGKIEIISTAPNSEEQKLNKKIAKMTHKVKRPKAVSVLDQKFNDDSAVRFGREPTAKPSWRE